MHTITFAIAGVMQGTNKDIEIRRTVALPFVPRAGDNIAPTDQDDLLPVESIYWSPAEGITVFFEAQEFSPAGLKEKQGHGWKIWEDGR